MNWPTSSPLAWKFSRVAGVSKTFAPGLSITLNPVCGLKSKPFLSAKALPDLISSGVNGRSLIIALKYPCGLPSSPWRISSSGPWFGASGIVGGLEKSIAPGWKEPVPSWRTWLTLGVPCCPWASCVVFSLAWSAKKFLTSCCCLLSISSALISGFIALDNGESGITSLTCWYASEKLGLFGFNK